MGEPMGLVQKEGLEYRIFLQASEGWDSNSSLPNTTLLFYSFPSRKVNYSWIRSEAFCFADPSAWFKTCLQAFGYQSCKSQYYQNTLSLSNLWMYPLLSSIKLHMSGHPWCLYINWICVVQRNQLFIHPLECRDFSASKCRAERRKAKLTNMAS